jgi:hypothetical protein
MAVLFSKRALLHGPRFMIILKLQFYQINVSDQFQWRKTEVWMFRVGTEVNEHFFH